MGIAQAMKYPTMAPFKLMTIVTSTLKKVNTTQKKIIEALYTQNAVFLRYSLQNCQRNSFLVRKLRIGITDRFCTNIPNCTILPKRKNTFYTVSLPFVKQSKIVEYLSSFSQMSLACGAQVRPPRNPTQTQIRAVSPYPSRRSLMLLAWLMFLLRMGAPTGCRRKLRAKAPATVLKSGSNSVYWSVKCNSPLARTLMRATMMKMPYAKTRQMVNLKNFISNSMSRLQIKGAVNRMQIRLAYCGEYLDKTRPFPSGATQPSTNSVKIAAVMPKKFQQMSMKQAIETTQISVILMTLLRRAHFGPRILLILCPKSTSSGRLCSTNSLQVKQRAAPMASSTISDPTMPSLMKTMGQTIILDPIMVLAMEVMTLKELSPPCSMISDFLRSEIRWFLMLSGMCFSAYRIPICTSTSAEFSSIIYIYGLKQYANQQPNSEKIILKFNSDAFIEDPSALNIKRKWSNFNQIILQQKTMQQRIIK